MDSIGVDSTLKLNRILQDQPYQVIERIAFGSYGEVFRVKDIKDEKQYGLKVISKQRMFKQQKLHEAAIENIFLSNLNHPGIIQYKHSIEDQQTISHVMQLCSYGSFKNLLQKIDKSIELTAMKQEILQFYLAQIVEVLEYLHQENKIIHRDIKLENLMIGPDLNCRLIDFGTSKPADLELAFTPTQLQFLDKIRQSYPSAQENSMRKASFVGSANYIAPESIKFDYSFKSDIWSFGVVMYTFFHGKLPFRGRNNYDILCQIFDFTKENQILNIGNHLTDQAKDLILQCLHPNPRQRPSISQIKAHPYFSKINFNQIFIQPSPLSQKHLNGGKETIPRRMIKTIYIEEKVQKRMFFGNFKPRVLKLYPDTLTGRIMMSYWHINGIHPKKQFELTATDSANKITDSTFEVSNMGMKYVFKSRFLNIEKLVTQINYHIKNHYTNAQ